MPRRLAHNVHTILAISAGLVVLVAGALGWLGWRLLSQEAALVRQQARERLEQRAEVVSAEFQRRMAETDSWLSRVGSTLPLNDPAQDRPGAGGLLVRFSKTGVETQPPGELLYYPAPPPSRLIEGSTFEKADKLEFQTEDLKAAAATLADLAAGKDRYIRDEALLRLASVQRKQGAIAEALATYARLSDETLIGPDEAPYGLLSRLARCQLLALSGQDAARREASQLVAGLESGRWTLAKEKYVFYDLTARKLAGLTSGESAPDAKLAVAEVVESMWNEWQVFPRSPSRSMVKRLPRSGRVPLLAIVNANQDRLVALIYTGDSIRNLGFEPASDDRKNGIRLALLDEQGQPIFGAKLEPGVGPEEMQVTRILSAAELPWSLKISGTAVDSAGAFLAKRRGYFILGLAGIILLVSVACYAMARGVLREAAAGRLQSDFVSAVSHEFRSPLTTLRQLTELLAQGRIRDESRRQLYFEVLQKETSRLHQLVEDLLDFGRMDAGRRQYRLEPIDFSELVRDGIHEYQNESNGNGHKIELVSDESRLVVQADREALRRVVRNLLENAVKYSPDCPTVWVETGCEERAAVLRVRDQGIGIPAEEQSRIFEKFVRGEAAKRACIKGTGIGLAMVKEIVQVHHGEVDLASEVGRGSTFRVRLPLSPSSTRTFNGVPE
jgi:signal transduction histidine kinase